MWSDPYHPTLFFGIRVQKFENLKESVSRRLKNDHFLSETFFCRINGSLSKYRTLLIMKMSDCDFGALLLKIVIFLHFLPQRIDFYVGRQ